MTTEPPDHLAEADLLGVLQGTVGTFVVRVYQVAIEEADVAPVVDELAVDATATDDYFCACVDETHDFLLERKVSCRRTVQLDMDQVTTEGENEGRLCLGDRCPEVLLPVVVCDLHCRWDVQERLL